MKTGFDGGPQVFVADWFRIYFGTITLAFLFLGQSWASVLDTTKYSQPFP